MGRHSYAPHAIGPEEYDAIRARFTVLGRTDETVAQIAVEFGRSACVIGKLAGKMGVPIRKTARLSPNVRMAQEPPRKLDAVLDAMRAGDWPRAIKLAARFQDLGAERGDILSAREAVLRPGFQRQLGRDPETLICAGKAALRRRYGHE